MLNFSAQLNPEQEAVVLGAEGPCLVLAGAGSGKTRVITYRVAQLLSQGVLPNEILLVTFTNKAAKEMMERVRQLVGEEIRLPWSGTFHHVGYKILRQHATVLGYQPNFSILDSGDSLELLKSCLKDEGIDRKEKRFPSPAVLQSVLSYARNAETTIEDVLSLKHPRFLTVRETIIRIAEQYQKRKIAANVMDFDDLLVNWHLLLAKSPELREKYARRFRYILVDEYQDTNHVQASIINLLAGHHQNLLVVGDDAQSIYSFRAADIKNILDFEKIYPQAKVFRLETNYRSTPEILAVANSVISNNSQQYEKELKSVVPSLAKPEVQVFADQKEEAQQIVGRLRELLEEEGIAPEKIAVLFRAAHHSQVLEMELMKNHLEYEYRGGVRFYERAHVKDVLAFLRVLNNQQDFLAWQRILNLQIGIGSATVGQIVEHLRQMSSFEDLRLIGPQLPPRAQLGWNNLWLILEALRAVPGNTPKLLIQTLLDSEYLVYLENEYPDFRERKLDIEQLAEFSQGAENLSEFLAQATMQETYQAAVDGRAGGKIILSTIHQAKGLEWEAVFVINLANGQFPNERALSEDGGLEEERRLFYVAITRAQRYLTLSYSLVSGFGGFLSGPSSFLEEISPTLLAVAGLTGQTVFSQPGAGGSDSEIQYLPEDQSRRGFLSDISDL